MPLALFKRKTPIELAEAGCRKVWKANPNAKWAWHLHHERLVERIDYYNSNPIDRVNFILNNKAESEQATRLILFRPVKDNSLFDKSGGTITAYFFSLKRVFPALYNQLEALHYKECHPCPWNGETIFPSQTKP